MHFRWLRMIAAFALLCGFTFIFPLNTAFAEDTKYQKISLNKWSEQNCKVIVNNSITKNTPFYLEYRNQSDLVTWAMGSSLSHIDANSDLILHDGIGTEFVSPPPETDICIRIPGNVSPLQTTSGSFKTVVYAGVGQKGNFSQNNAKNFRIDWTVTQVSSPQGIIQKNIEIGELGAGSFDTAVTSQIKYKPLVKGMSLAEDIQVDEEEPIMFSFNSAGIYTLTIQADIKYNGVKNSQFVTTYKLVVGNEATFENQAPEHGSNPGANSGDTGNKPNPSNPTPGNPPTPGENKTPGTTSTPATENSTNKATVNPRPLPLPSVNNPAIQLLNPALGNTRRNTSVPLLVEPHSPQALPAPDSPKNNAELEPPTKNSVAADIPRTVSRADRTVAREAGLNFLQTAPLLVVGAVVVIGAGAAASLFLKIKP